MNEKEIRDQAWGLRLAIGVVIAEEASSNKGYSEDYRRGWEDACSVILKQLKVSYNQADPKPVG